MLSSGVHGRGLLDRLREGADFDTVTPEKEIEDQKNDLLGEKWLVWYWTVLYPSALQNSAIEHAYPNIVRPRNSYSSLSALESPIS